MILDHLRQAEQHVAEGEAHIAKQERIIAQLEQDGHDTTAAEELLATLLESQALHEQGARTWRAELEKLERDAPP